MQRNSRVSTNTDKKTPATVLGDDDGSSQDHEQSSPRPGFTNRTNDSQSKRKDKVWSGSRLFLPGLVAVSIILVVRMASMLLRTSSLKRPQTYRQVTPPEHGGFEFRGTTRTGAGREEGRPRIAIITNAVAHPYTEQARATWSVFKEYFANKDCYARTHGYDLIVDSRCCAVPFCVGRDKLFRFTAAHSMALCMFRRTTFTGGHWYMHAAVQN